MPEKNNQQAGNLFRVLQKTLTDNKIKFTLKRNAVIVNDTFSVSIDPINYKHIVYNLKLKKEILVTAKVADVIKIFKAVKEVTTVSERAKKPLKKKIEKKVRRTRREFREAMNVKVQYKSIDKKQFLDDLNTPASLTDLYYANNKLVTKFKGVLNSLGGSVEVVAVNSNEYQLLTNIECMQPVLNYLAEKRLAYNIDRLSYIDPTKARLHLTFPKFKIKDGSKKGILASIFVNNSYDGSESFNLMAGAMKPDGGGMLILSIMDNVKITHAQRDIQDEVNERITELLSKIKDTIPAIENKISYMQQSFISPAQMKRLALSLDSKVLSHLLRTLKFMDSEMPNNWAKKTARALTDNDLNNITEWNVYIILTDYISSYVSQRLRLDNLRRLAKILSI